MATVTLPQAERIAGSPTPRRQEASALRLLPAQYHPNLLPAFAMLETARACYWLLPWMPFTLADVVQLKEGGIHRSISRKLFIVYQLAHALDALHRRGLAHGRCVPVRPLIHLTRLLNVLARRSGVRWVLHSVGMSHVLLDDGLWARLALPALARPEDEAKPMDDDDDATRPDDLLRRLYERGYVRLPKGLAPPPTSSVHAWRRLADAPRPRSMVWGGCKNAQTCRTTTARPSCGSEARSATLPT